MFYWDSINHPIAQTLANSLYVFNDYFVENFHSSIRLVAAAADNDSNIPKTTNTGAAEVVNIVLNSNIDQLYSNVMNNFSAA
ncbi:19730_t:CDS:2 [Dentiscutata erythropus]|uniref:19730_t:CDS:1 n=1 Tax=Dentiscutata erythropus TaxID=1348616 RepID=A0A9N9DHD1_9GLOM|nr:19730_t:CDS:2 [Dentiscutata erythropus]